MPLVYTATGPDDQGDYHAGYWSGGIHRHPEFRSMALCSSMEQARQAATELNKEALVRELETAMIHTLRAQRRPVHGFYNDGEQQ